MRAGGERIGNRGLFWKPIVVTDVPPDARLMRDDPFDPIAAIVRFSDEGEVLERANALPCGLAAHALTRDADRAFRVAERIESGLVGLNTFAVTVAETPFDGVEESGCGSEGGSEGLEAYLVTELVSQASVAT